MKAALAGVPQGAVDLTALIRKRSELKDQLQSISERRDVIAAQSQNVPDAASAREAQGRMKVLDTRSARLEQQILEVDDAIAQALASGISTNAPPGIAAEPPPQQWMTVPPPPPPLGSAVGRVMFVEGLAFVLLGVVLLRYVWNRAEKKFSRAAASAAPAVDQSGRFDQLQQAVDVIALEVERISESQRYVAKLMNEKQPAIGAGEAQPISAKGKATVPARADEIE